MKKLPTFLNIILVGLVVLLGIQYLRAEKNNGYSAFQYTSVAQSNNDAYQNRKEAAVEDFITQLNKQFSNDSLEIKKRSEHSFDDIQWAFEYINRYEIEYKNRILQRKGKTVWIDSATIGNLYRFISNEHCDGARIYLTKYPRISKKINGVTDAQRSAYGRDQGVYNRRYSVILVATKFDPTSKEHNNYVKSMKKYENNTLFLKQSETDANTLTYTGPYDGIYNYHDICPPDNCGGFVPENLYAKKEKTVTPKK